MNNNFNPYGKKTHAGDYGTYFNLFYYYVEKYKDQPNIFEYGASIKKSSFKKLEDLGVKKFYSCDLEKIIENKNVLNEIEFCYEYEDALIFFYRKESLLSRIEYAQEIDDEDWDSNVDFKALPKQKDFAVYRCKILYKNKDTLDKLRSKIEVDNSSKKHSNVFLLCTMDGMLSLQRFDVKLPQKDIDLDLNYGKEASMKFEKIINHLKNNKNGLILFSGDPGTGKSTFIKYLTTKTSRKVIYLSSAAAEQLTNPDFLSFIMGHRNCILLLEDAEKILRSRENSENDAISNILNISDGILGDCLNIMVIATFNTSRENIDSALVRKGRLIVEHHFKPLSSEESNKLLKKIGSKKRTEQPMTLADIYNEDDNFHSKEEKRKVGF